MRTQCSNMLSFFINFFLSLSSVLVSFSSLFSPLLCQTISSKLHPLHLTILANSHHLLPKKLTKNTQTSQQITQKLYNKKPHRHHQIALCKSYLKPRKYPHCNHIETQPKNQKIRTEKYPKPH